MNKFDRFCRKYERYGIKNLMTIIVAGQGAMGLLFIMLSMSNPSGTLLFYSLNFDPKAFLSGEVWRLVTFLFVPETLGALLGGFNLVWFIISLFFYFWVGRSLEALLGRLKMTIYYFSGVLISVVFSLLSGVEASLFFLNLSLFFALATLMPDEQIRLYFLIPIKLKYVAIIQAVLYIALPFFYWPLRLGNLFPLMSILNYLLFFGKTLFNQVRLLPRHMGANKRTVRFKSEVKRAKSQRGYIHKCAICGQTDTERPDMEFRYCSLCAGYACYCAEHIFNHPHKTIQ